MYVHCIDGVTATGTLVMCLRKLQRWGWALPLTDRGESIHILT